MTLQFSCHSWGFNDVTLVEALGTIARLGFRYVDIGTGSHLNTARATAPATREAMLKEVLNDLDMFNLQVADVYLMLPRISADDETKRDTDIKVFKALLPFIKLMNAKGITVSSGLVHPPEDVEAFERTVSALRDMLEAAQKAGLPLSIEPHLDSMAQTPAQAHQLLQKVEGLQITLDWAHMVCQKAKPADIVSLLPHTRHVQLRQAAPNKLQTPYDKGKIEFAEVWKELQNHQYQGFISIETLQTLNWHGTMKVNNTTESALLRDKLRELRDTQ
jgi:sugar phosphate isomerase/epimerase